MSISENDIVHKKPEPQSDSSQSEIGEVRGRNIDYGDRASSDSDEEEENNNKDDSFNEFQAVQRAKTDNNNNREKNNVFNNRGLSPNGRNKTVIRKSLFNKTHKASSFMPQS